MIKIIGIGLFAVATWTIPYYTESWGLFVVMASMLCLFLLMFAAQFLKHGERLVFEIFIFASLLMSIKCILGTPYKIDAMSHLGAVIIICIGLYHFYQYRQTLKR